VAGTDLTGTLAVAERGHRRRDGGGDARRTLLTRVVPAAILGLLAGVLTYFGLAYDGR
jgi:hypothetical protein